jgi:hypothetical protein
MKRPENTKKTIAIVSIGIILLVGGSVAGILINQANTSSEASNSTVKTDAPEFETVSPKNKSVNSIGGWSRISPPASDPVYAYTDTIDGISISVSEQPLPTSFKGNESTQVAELAKKFFATDTIDADGTKVYIGTSAKGPQSVIFTKDSLLILIKSEQKVNDAAWASYINSLQ